MIALNCLINQCKPLFIMIGLITLLVACSSEKGVDEDLQAAFKIHNEAIKIRQLSEDQLNKLGANSDSLFIATYKSDLDSISQLLKAWDEQLVEVPGFEEAHDHAGHYHDHSGHDHHHHNEGADLSPKQHLEVQQYLLKEVKGIASRINELEKK